MMNIWWAENTNALCNNVLEEEKSRENMIVKKKKQSKSIMSGVEPFML